MDKDLINTPGKEQDEHSREADTSGQTAAPAGQHTRVENAHAAGAGAMGRNDEKLPSGEDGAAEPAEGPAY